MENNIKNDLLYVCTLIEHIGRTTNNHRKDIVFKLGVEEIERLLKYANINHCLDLQQVSDEISNEYNITKGDFDTITKCKYNVPSVQSIGKVYQRLVMDIQKKDQQLSQTIYDVFISFISDEISNFNSNVYYSNPEYLKYSYLEGTLLD